MFSTKSSIRKMSDRPFWRQLHRSEGNGELSVSLGLSPPDPLRKIHDNHPIRLKSSWLSGPRQTLTSFMTEYGHLHSARGNQLLVGLEFSLIFENSVVLPLTPHKMRWPDLGRSMMTMTRCSAKSIRTPTSARVNMSISVFAKWCCLRSCAEECLCGFFSTHGP